MKKTLTNLFSFLNEEQVNNLTKVVNETIATDFNMSNSKTFTAVDLWNIHRQGKSRIQRRQSF